MGTDTEFLFGTEIDAKKQISFLPIFQTVRDAFAFAFIIVMGYLMYMAG